MRKPARHATGTSNKEKKASSSVKKGALMRMLNSCNEKSGKTMVMASDRIGLENQPL
jgi:hypothetical protein